MPKIQKCRVSPTFALLEMKLYLSLLLAPASAADWFIKGCAMCYHVCNNACKRYLVSVIRVGHSALVAGFFLCLYSPHVLKKNGHVIQTNKTKTTNGIYVNIVFVCLCTKFSCFAVDSQIRSQIIFQMVCGYSGDNTVSK